MYDTLIRAVETYFDEIKVLKRGARGTVKLVRHRDTGKRYIFRCFDGSDEVYRRLLTVDCPYLPRIEEAAASCGRVAVLEEYVQGDTLLYLLEGSVLDWSEARKVTADICGALGAAQHGRGTPGCEGEQRYSPGQRRGAYRL